MIWQPTNPATARLIIDNCARKKRGSRAGIPIEMTDKLIINTIEKNELIKRGDHVIVGLSGGTDSVCLLFALIELKPILCFEISAVHVNHKLRPGDAEKDQEYAEALCSEAGLICDVSVCDCLAAAKERGVTTEEAGRNLRYEAYYRAAKALIEKGVPAENIKIAVAQNKNDQAETLLMRLLRGTGINGLAGIEYKRAGEHGTTIIRPLLDIERKDIEKYCKDKGLSPRTDHTNEQPLYTRNKVRLELIPFIEANFNGNIIEVLARLSRNAKEDCAYLQTQAEEAYKNLKKESSEIDAFTNIEKKVILDREGLKKSNPAIRRRVMLMAFSEIGLNEDVSAAHQKLMDSVILSENASARVHLPQNYMLAVSYGNAAVYLNLSTNDLTPEGPPKLRFKALTIDEYKAGGVKKTRGIAAFDLERVIGEADNALERLTVRGRQQGDYFTPSGMKTGRKKVQDYFVDRKIPKERRDQFRLVASGSEALLIYDPLSGKHNETSEKYKVTDSTKEVLILEID
jgi:tRNA(Ile)-lysidine synthase